ncbi:MAG: YraN family protein [Puniceicoccaceae bacterium]
MFSHLRIRLRSLFAAISNPVAHDRRSMGQLGEQLAAQFLKRHARFKVLASNWSNGQQEIDLVCREGNVLVFVEVRARQDGARVPGFASLTRKKRRNLRKAAYAYLRTLRPRPRTYRYDAVELRMQGTDATEIHHFRNIDVF